MTIPHSAGPSALHSEYSGSHFPIKRHYKLMPFMHNRYKSIFLTDTFIVIVVVVVGKVVVVDAAAAVVVVDLDISLASIRMVYL